MSVNVQYINSVRIENHIFNFLGGLIKHARRRSHYVKLI